MRTLLAVKIDGNTFAPAAKFQNIPNVISALLPNVFLLAGIICMGIFIYAGFKFMMSKDVSAEEIGKIRTLIVTAGVGMGVIFGSYFIMKIIGTLLNITLPF